MPNQTYSNGTAPIAAKQSGSKDYGGELSYVSRVCASRTATALSHFPLSSLGKSCLRVPVRGRTTPARTFAPVVARLKVRRPREGPVKCPAHNLVTRSRHYRSTSRLSTHWIGVAKCPACADGAFRGRLMQDLVPNSRAPICRTLGTCG